MQALLLPRHAGPALALCLAVATHAQPTWTFVNDTPAAHDSWDSGNDWASAFTRAVDVSGVPQSGMVLRQVVLVLGSDNSTNISTLSARLTDPSGNTVQLLDAGYFHTTGLSKYVTLHLRDHPQLQRLSDYTNSYLGMPYAFGYYRTEAPDAFAAFNTTAQVNGTWTFAMIENTAVEIAFERVELVFGPPLQVIDITGSTSNAGCPEPYCLRSGADEVVIATNSGYPQSQPAFPPLTTGGCNWNAEANNTAWFRFTASDPVVRLSISGFGNNIQQTIVLRNTGSCAAPQYALVGCPWSMFVPGCNVTTGDPQLYHRVCYDGGSKFNHGYTLTGLQPGVEYLLLVDGQSGADATFYIELASGADGSCPALGGGPVIDSVVTIDPGCDGTGGAITINATGSGLQFSIDGGLIFQPSNAFVGLGPGTYTIVVQDDQGDIATEPVTLTAPPVPAIVSVEVTDAQCGQQNGTLLVNATGDDLTYNLDGAAAQTDPLFTALAPGGYTVQVVNAFGCVDSVAATVQGTGFPVIDAVVVSTISCTGEADGVIDVTASDPGTLVYSINGGSASELNVFTGLPAGTWTITVSNGLCAVDTTIVLADPPPVVLTLLSVSEESCAGACDGDIAVAADGAIAYSMDGGPAQATGLFLALCPGTYTITAEDANGCVVTEDYVVQDGATVVAGFTYEPPDAVVPGVPVQFSNTSTGAQDYFWTTGGWGGSIDVDPQFTFPAEAFPVTVCLQALSFQGCADTLCAVIEAAVLPELELPNIFTPNGDGRNDTFGLMGPVEGLRDIRLEVFNRFGQLLFSGTRPREVWDGRQIGGEPAPEGTYFWTLECVTETGEAVSRSGHLTLTR